MLLDPKKPRKRSVPPKPGPVETAEEFAHLLYENCHEIRTYLVGGMAWSEDLAAPLIEARDAALAADAEARGAKRALDEFERLCRGGHLHGEALAMFERLHVKYTAETAATATDLQGLDKYE